MKFPKMKSLSLPPWLRALTAALVVLPAAAATVETPVEFQIDADFDGDGRADVIVVDKTSGAFRVGYQTVPGAPSWAEARATGVQDVTGVNAGRLLSLTRDALAVVSPAANRVTLLEATNETAPVLPLAVFPPSIGPNAVATVDIVSGGNTAHDDLYVLSRENPGPRETLLRNNGVTQPLLGDNALSAYRSGPNRFELKSGQPPRVGLFNRLPPGTNDIFVALDFQTGAATALFTTVVPLANSPAAPEFVAARFNALPHAQVLFYQPGTNTLVRFQAVEPVAGTFNLAAPVAHNLGGTIQRVVLAPGPSDTRLVVLFGEQPTNATVARLFSYDGTNAPVLVQSYTNTGGFAGATALGGGHLALLGSDGSGRSVSYEVKLRNGAGYTDGASGALPGISPYSGSANVLLMSSEPFVSPTARSVRNLRAGEWSSAIAFTGAAPAKVVVRAERYGGVSNGLVNPVPTVLGNVPSGATHALVNQYTNPISIFSLAAANGDQPGRISIAPPSGEYQSAVQAVLSTTPANWIARFRLSPAASWQAYAAPITIFSNTVLECYAVDPLSTAKTPVEKVGYTFTTSANLIDSDQDGVPDAVEVAKGLDPRKGNDTDGDGYSDLEEILGGSNPNAVASVPASRIEVGGNFERIVTPLAPDGSGAMTLSATGMNVRAWSLSRVFLAETTTANLFLPGIQPSAARYIAKPGDGESLILETTDQHFDFTGSTSTQKFGRELVGAVRVPPIGRPELPELSPALDAVAISAWIVATSNLLANYPRQKVVHDLTPASTAAALLLEKVMADALVARGTNGGTNATLFPFRTPDVIRAPMDAAVLIHLEAYAGPSSPAYLAGTVFDYLHANVASNNAAAFASLRAVANEFWRVSSAHLDINTNAMILPLDGLRHFIATGVVHPDYAPFFAAGGQLAAAGSAVQSLLASAPRRPTTNMTIEVVAISPDAPTTFRVLGGTTPVTLWKSGGVPCVLPASFNLIAGSRLSLFGFSDVAEEAGTLGVEVISLALASVPVVSATDLDGDLLLDAWENVFFGGTGGDPFGDTDGDGYSDLQEQLAGTDPNNPANLPAVPPVNFSNPSVNLEPAGNQLKIVFNWPQGYAGFFNFGVTSTDDLGGAFTPLAASPPAQRGGDPFEVTLTPPDGQWGDPHRFFILNVGLR